MAHPVSPSSAVIGHLSSLLDHTNPDIREQAGWCVGNIAGEGVQYRDLLLAGNVHLGVLKNIQFPANVGILKNLTWTFSNLCRGKPHVDIDLVKAGIPTLVSLVKQEFKSVVEDTTEEDCKDVVVDASWALSYLTDGSDERIKCVAGIPGAVQLLVDVLTTCESFQVITPVLRAVGNIVSGNEEHTQMVLDCGVMRAVPKLLVNAKKSVRKVRAASRAVQFRAIRFEPLVRSQSSFASRLVRSALLPARCLTLAFRSVPGWSVTSRRGRLGRFMSFSGTRRR